MWGRSVTVIAPSAEAVLAAGTMWSADEIAELCYEHYRTRLPKQGKPDPSREWTLLAAVVKVESVANGEGSAGVGSLQGENRVVLCKLRGSGESS